MLAGARAASELYPSFGDIGVPCTSKSVDRVAIVDEVLGFVYVALFALGDTTLSDVRSENGCMMTTS